MTLSELHDKVCHLLEKPFNARVLLSHARFPGEERNSSEVTDPNNIPFYYQLGKLLDSENVVEVGLRLGIIGSALTQSCKSIKEYLAIQLKTEAFYSTRLANANIRDHFEGELYTHVGFMNDESFKVKLEAHKWDLAIIDGEFDDQYLLLLETLWPRLKTGGWLVCDYARRKPIRQALDGFYKSVNRDPIFINTRYGISVAKK